MLKLSIKDIYSSLSSKSFSAMLKGMKTVAVGLSGGVDSSVAAYLLKQKGYKVVAFFMKNWDEDDEICPAKRDYEDALIVSHKLNIPLYTLNFSQNYWDEVFTSFLEGLKKGETPNPDILCNKEIKFKVFLEKAKELGADFLATGHYAAISKDFELMKAIDENKDQSYFLYTLKKEILENVLFPLGEYEKPEIRALAKKLGLITHDKKDSTGICFIGKRNFRDFIKTYLSPKEGYFVTPDGKTVGTHMGAWYYTIGQRKGLGIGGAGDAWYVVSKEINSNTVTVVQGENNPLLYHKTLIASNASWVFKCPIFPLTCKAKIRYRQKESLCLVEKEGEQYKVTFDSMQKAITQGQSIVFYQDNICLGGAIINSSV